MSEINEPGPTAGASTGGLVGAAVAVTAWGAGSVIAKGIDMDPLAIGVYRFTLFALVLSIWMRSRGQSFRLHILRHSIAGGVALGLDIALFFSAVKLTNVVNATLIGSLQPVFVGVVAARFFGETIARRDALLSLVALVGVGLVVVASNGTPEWSAEGDLLAVGAMVTWGLYFIASKRSKEQLTSSEFTLGTAVWSALILLPLSFAFDQDLSWPGRTSLFWLVVMLFVAGFVGHSLMNWSLVRVPLWVGSTFTLLIPVTSSLIAWAALGEALNGAQVGAMGVVLLALVLIVRNQSTGSPGTTRPVVPEPDSVQT